MSVRMFEKRTHGLKVMRVCWSRLCCFTSILVLKTSQLTGTDALTLRIGSHDIRAANAHFDGDFSTIVLGKVGQVL